MKSIKRGLAVLLAVLLIIPTLPVSAEELNSSGSIAGQTTEQMTGPEGTPVPEEAPAAEETPTPEAEPSVGETPGPEETPVAEGTPGPEGTPSAGETPGPEEGTPSVEETPTPEETPAAEEIPTAEVTASPEETAAPDASSNPEETAIPITSAVPGETPAVSASPEGTPTPAVPAVSAVPTASPDIAASASPSVSPVPSATPTPSASPTPEESVSPEELVTDKVLFNTGSHAFSIVNAEAFEAGAGDGCFDENGDYTINIPEANPFFPYEVQFTYEDEVTNEWFMSPDDSVEIGGHSFYVSAYFDNSSVTQMSLNVAGDTVVVYPEEKEFTDGTDEIVMSLLPLEEKRLWVDLSGYTPVELTMVSLTEVFTGENALTDTDKVVWKYSGNSGDNYDINMPGDRIDLSYSYSYEMIVGAANQLASDNTRYIISLSKTYSSQWLVPTVYTQTDAAIRENIDVSGVIYYSSRLDFDVQESDIKEGDKTYVSLSVNDNVFPDKRYSSLKIYEGQHTTPEEAMAGTDITSQILNVDMNQANAGCEVKAHTSKSITIVSFDASGNVTGCLPLKLYMYAQSNSTSTTGAYVSRSSLFKRTESGREYVTYDYSGYDNRTITLYKEYPANGTYYQTMSCSGGTVTGAYVGQYTSIEEAAAAGIPDIKDSLFSSDSKTGGYGTDYSQGIYFTVFVNENETNEQKVFVFYTKTVDGTVSSLNSGTGITFQGLNDSNGTEIDAYIVSHNDDSYGESNFITILVEEDQDVTNLAPIFRTQNGIRLYTEGSNEPEVSGESYHDFSGGAVQYSAAAENGTNLKNYWLQVVKANSGYRLYINSLADAGANTRIENGIIYSTREVMLDYYHDYQHDIFIANMGMEDIPALKAELSSDVVVLDDYWTLNGDYNLAGFKTTSTTTNYGELPNLAKVRLKAKEGISGGADVSGTLTIKSGDTVLMVLTLTGTVGNPCITTEEIPQAVKYVPYGSVIQNNNKYSWNKASYSLADGTLPEGMEVKSNGEIYGVPKEAGEFTFTVKMENSYTSFSSSEKTFTLTVVENTDANVDGATDTGYDLSQRVQNVQQDASSGSQTLVSEGIYSEFVDIYLDGVKLAEGTDYTSESGSTRITILNQTLAQGGNGGTGTHTLGVEFRTQDTDELMRAAQNYVVEGPENPEDDDNGENGEDDGNGGGNNAEDNDGNSEESSSTQNTVGIGNSSGAASGNAAGAGGASTAAAGADAAEAVSYTVASGDTLWKIAEKFYGSGEYWQKIYNDNADIISNPDRIYVGQKLLIYPLQGDAVTAAMNHTAGSSTETSDSMSGNYYTVQPGDTLWKIALKVYGKGWRWRKIYQANQAIISDPGKLYVGQVLVIPD